MGTLGVSMEKDMDALNKRKARDVPGFTRKGSRAFLLWRAGICGRWIVNSGLFCFTNLFVENGEKNAF